MIRYIITAQALRLFSLNSATKRVYRNLGNTLGGRRRSKGLPDRYVPRANGNLQFIESYGGIRDGMHVVELGTGWVHWEAFFTRLFYDVTCTLFDVWDNRQFGGFQRYAHELRQQLRSTVARPEVSLRRAEILLDEVSTLPNFDAVYERLGFQYMIDPQGSLRELPDACTDLIISSDVLEHVPVGSVDSLISDMYRILKPGGMAAQLIVPWDHLAGYDSRVHGKNYLRYGDRIWRTFFENDVQYFNRLQHSEWIERFRRGKMEVVCAKIIGSDNLGDLPISHRFRGYSREDLEGTVSQILVRKLK